MRITIKNLQKKIPIYPKRIKRAILKAFSLEGIKKSGEIAVCFLSDEQIRELNLMYLGENCPTDVIAFDNSTKNAEILADIAVSSDTAIRNARLFDTSPLYELYLYVIHGVLHILGYTDNTAAKRKKMQKKAVSILSTLHL